MYDIFYYVHNNLIELLGLLLCYDVLLFCRLKLNVYFGLYSNWSCMIKYEVDHNEHDDVFPKHCWKRLMMLNLKACFSKHSQWPSKSFRLRKTWELMLFFILRWMSETSSTWICSRICASIWFVVLLFVTGSKFEHIRLLNVSGHWYGSENHDFNLRRRKISCTCDRTMIGIMFGLFRWLNEAVFLWLHLYDELVCRCNGNN